MNPNVGWSQCLRTHETTMIQHILEEKWARNTLYILGACCKCFFSLFFRHGPGGKGWSNSRLLGYIIYYAVIWLLHDVLPYLRFFALLLFSRWFAIYACDLWVLTVECSVLVGRLVEIFVEILGETNRRRPRSLIEIIVFFLVCRQKWEVKFLV